MEKLVISPDFTVEDIHKIREANYERTKSMTIEEKIAYYNNSGKEAEKEIARRRAIKRKDVVNIWCLALCSGHGNKECLMTCVVQYINLEGSKYSV